MRRTRLAWVILAGIGVGTGCGGGDGGGSTGPTTGTVSGTAAAGGTGVGGVALSLERSGQTTRNSTTSASGSFSFTSVEAGAWTLEITAPTGFSLAQGQAAAVPVTVTGGGTATVNVALTDLGGGGGPTTTVITLAGTSFSDNDVTIDAGETIRWEYQNGGPHTVTPDGHSEWNEVTLDAAGETFSHTFNTPGVYAYFCVPHAPGMSGVIRVQ